MHNGANKGRKAVVVISIIVIVLCFAVIGVSLFTIFKSSQGNLGEDVVPPAESPSVSGGPVIENNSLSTLTLDVTESETLIELVAFLATENVYDGTPAYVFVGRKYQTQEDSVLESDPESLAQMRAESYMKTYSDLVSFAREAASDWSIPYDEFVTYLSTCLCIQNDNYIFVAGAEEYQPLAKVFEQAINDPTVLDMEDLIAKLTEFQIEG